MRQKKTTKENKILHSSHKFHVKASGRKGLAARNIEGPKCARVRATLEKNHGGEMAEDVIISNILERNTYQVIKAKKSLKRRTGNTDLIKNN